jgi:acyl carrier protein
MERAMSALYESVVDAFAERFGIERSLIVPEASFDDLGLDSLAQIELATTLQKRLGVVLSDEEIIELTIVSDIVAILEKKEMRV